MINGSIGNFPIQNIPKMNKRVERPSENNKKKDEKNSNQKKKKNEKQKNLKEIKTTNYNKNGKEIMNKDSESIFDVKC